VHNRLENLLGKRIGTRSRLEPPKEFDQAKSRAVSGVRTEIQPQFQRGTGEGSNLGRRIHLEQPASDLQHLALDMHKPPLFVTSIKRFVTPDALNCLTAAWTSNWNWTKSPVKELTNI
jgi:hypothetical protein